MDLNKQKGAKKNKNKIIIFGVVVTIFIIVVASIAIIRPFAIQYDPDGGGTTYTVVPDAPVLNTLPFPDPDTDGQITLSWSNPGSLYGFRLYRSVGINRPYYLFKSLGSTTTSYTFNEVNGAYFYKILAYNNMGNGAYSIEVGTIVMISQPVINLPSVPVLNSIQSPDIDGSISLSWSASQYVDNYEVFRSVSGGSSTLFRTLTSTSVSFTEVDGSYSYKIRAHNADGYSVYSNIVSVVVDIPIVVPPIPITPPVLNAIASPSDTGDIYISWNSVPNAVDYSVYRSSDGVSYTYLKKVYTTSCNDLGLTDGTYYYKIKAANSNREYSDFSNVESVIVAISVIPDPIVIPDPVVPSDSSEDMILTIGIGLSVFIVFGLLIFIIFRIRKKKIIKNRM